jgi:transposase
MMAFSLDLRKRVIAAVDSNMHVDEATKVFKVSRRVIYEWLELRKETGSLAPKSGYQKGHSHKITDWDQFKVFVEKHKHCASPQMRIEWKKLTGVEVCESVMLRALKKIGYTSKKKLLVIPKQTKKSVSYSWKKLKI